MSINNIKNIIELLYYIAGIGLFGTLIVAVVQLKVLKKDLHDRNKRAAVEKSLELLNFFASELVPLINKYINRVNTEIKNPKNVKHLMNDEFSLNIEEIADKEILSEAIIRGTFGNMDILNHLEFFSVAMLNGVADEGIVFTPVGKLFCECVEREYITIAGLRSNGKAPFNNLVELYTKWHNKLELEKLELEKLKTEEKMSSLNQSNNEVDPPIGF